MAMAVAGQDSICVKRKPSSTILPSELRRFRLFSTICCSQRQCSSLILHKHQSKIYVYMRLSDFGLCEEDGDRNLAIGIRRFFILHSDRLETQ
ncbi:hypothetical protein LXL04_012092 [Taraxacum kok-saghyz]